MDSLFYLTAIIAGISALMVVSRHNAVHALLYLVATILSLAVLFYLLGSPFAALLEVIVYAGAIIILMVFVIMMLNQGDSVVEQEKKWLDPASWWGPALLTFFLMLETLYIIKERFLDSPSGVERSGGLAVVSAKQVGIDLFGPYLLAVELASFLLLAALIGAFHLARGLKKTDSATDNEASL
ncbi:MAG: NADH-quinone oxidoreductase subunit J [Spongiibacteraceae bacterium]|nr:NADH-quinone oxidoreductase subunit J [Spongiibacteraceae bacterium]